MTAKTYNLTAAHFIVGPARTRLGGSAEDHFEFIPPDYPQATAEEFAAAAASALPFSYEAAGIHFTGTAILTNDGRIVVVSKSGERGVAKLTPDGAARVRASMEGIDHINRAIQFIERHDGWVLHPGQDLHGWLLQARDGLKVTSPPVAPAKPITWTCDPPEFAAYVSTVSAIDRGDFLMINLDMRAKRVPTHASERMTWNGAINDYDHAGCLDIRFFTKDPTADIIYPKRLGPYAGKPPVLTIHHGRSDLHIEAESQGRYSVRVFLTRQIERDAIDINPGDDATKVAHDRGVNDR